MYNQLSPLLRTAVRTCVCLVLISTVEFVIGGSGASAQLDCDLTVGLIREEEAVGFTKAQFEADLKSGWATVVKNVSIIEGESVDANETVLVVGAAEPGLPVCGTSILDLLPGIQLDLLAHRVQHERESGRLPIAPCLVAGLFALDDQVRSRFPFITWSCQETSGVVQGVVYLGARVTEGFKSCASHGISLRFVPLSSRGVEERCRELGRRLRDVMSTIKSKKPLPVFVVVDGANSLGNGRAIIANLTYGIINTSCLPGSKYLKTTVAHEAGHLMLQLLDHPLKSSCGENIMIEGNHLGEITDSQIRRVCEQEMVDCGVDCSSLVVSTAGQECLTTD